MESEKVVVDELPLAIVRRVVKDKLSECSPDYDVSIHKEALVAFSESARMFIHYLSATANDFCKDSRRQTMKADDVFKAIEEMDFAEFLEPLKASLEEFKKKNAGKKAGGGTTSKPGGGAATKPRETKKRKPEGASTQKGVRRSKRDEGENKSDQIVEENEKDNTGENGNDEDDNAEENGNDEENEKEDEENGNEDEENGNEENSMEENGNESGNEDHSMEENGSGNGEDNENEDGNESGEEDE